MKLYSAKVDDIAKPVDEEVVKEKKPRTEKQIAALEKAKEARKRKREEIIAKKEEIKEKEKEIDEAVEQAVAKKADKVQEVTPPVESPEPEEVVVEKKSRKQVNPKRLDEHEPPAWFKTFIANTKAEEAKLSKLKKPRKQVRQEAEEMAQHQWQDSHTRDRVNTQAENHMRQMHQLYGQIFRR